MFFFLVVKDAVFILEPCASHPIRAFCAVLESMIATPSICAAFSSSCPVYNKSSPLASLFCPACSHLISLNPSRAMLYRRISADTFAAFPASYMVLTFHVAMVVVFLVDRRVVGTEVSFRLWSPHVILPAGAGPSSPRTGVSWTAVNASVAKSIFPGWGCWPHAQPSWKDRVSYSKLSLS